MYDKHDGDRWLARGLIDLAEMDNDRMYTETTIFDNFANLILECVTINKYSDNLEINSDDIPKVIGALKLVKPVQTANRLEDLRRERDDEKGAIED